MSLARFICQLTTVQIEFVELVSEMNQIGGCFSRYICLKYFKMMAPQLSRIRCKSGSRTSLCCCSTRCVSLSTSDIHTMSDHYHVKYPQTWFIPLIHFTNEIYTFDINIYRYIRRGSNDKDLFLIRISSGSVKVKWKSFREMFLIH